MLKNRILEMHLRLSILLLLLLTTSCASTVQPWEKGILAKKEMQFVSDGPGYSLDNHIHFSKEGSSGGTMTVGGGCGCN